MKKVIEAILILWVSLPLLFEAMNVFTNLENYKFYIGWFTNRLYRSNTYYYTAAIIEIILVFLIFIDVKRKIMLYLGFLIIITWQVLKFVLMESDRFLGYLHLRFTFSKPEYFTILGVYVAIGIVLFYLTYYRNNKKGIV